MAKGALFIAFAACLLATGHSLLPLDSIINTLTGTVGGLSGSVTGILGGLTKTVTGLLDTVLELLTAVLKALAETLSGTLNSVLGAPLDVLNNLLVSIKGLLYPKEIVSGLTSALEPALKAVSGLSKQLTGTATCLVNTIVGNLTTEVLKGVPEVVSCAKPLIKEVSLATIDVGQIVVDSVGVAAETTQKITLCAQNKATTLDLGETLNCILAPVGKSLQEVVKLVAETTPGIQSSIKSALGVPQCVQDVLLTKIRIASSLVNSVVQCAASNGVNVTAPQLPNNIPNFSDVANSAFCEIDSIISNAIGPNSNINALLLALKKLKDASDTASVSSIKDAISAVFKGIQDEINEIGADPKNLAAIACANEAQTSVDNLGEHAAKIIATNVVSTAPDAASLVSQTAQLDLALKEIAIRGTTDALTKCSGLALATDNSAEKCFKDRVQEIKKQVADLQDKIVKAIGTANGLIQKINNNLSFGLQMVKGDVEKITAKLSQCVSR